MAKELIVRDYVGIKSSATKIGKDVDGNMTFTDAVTGTKKLSELVPGTDRSIANLQLNETAAAGKVMQILSSGKVTQVTGAEMPPKIPYYSTSFAPPVANTGIFRVRMDPNDSTRFVILYTGYVNPVYNVYMCAGTVTSTETITLGTPVLIFSPTTVSGSMYKFSDVDFDKLTPNRVSVISVDVTNAMIKCTVCTLTGLSIFVGSFQILVSTIAVACGTAVTNDPNNAGKFVFTYGIGTTIYARVLQLDSGGSATVGSAVAITNGVSGEVEWVPGVANRVLYATTSGYSYTIYAMVLAINGTVISTSTQYNVSTDNSGLPRIAFDPNNVGKFIMGWKALQSPYEQKGVCGTISDVAISLGTVTTLSSSVYSTVDPFAGIAFSNTVPNLVFFYHAGASQLMYSGTLTLSGTTISVVANSAISIVGVFGGVVSVPGTNKFMTVLASKILVWNINGSNIPYYGAWVNTTYSALGFAFDPFNKNRFLVATGDGSYIRVYLYSLVNEVPTLLDSKTSWWYFGRSPSGLFIKYDPLVQGRFLVAGGGSSGAFAASGSITNDVISASSGGTSLADSNSYRVWDLSFDKNIPNVAYVGCDYYTYAYVKKVVLTGTSSMTSVTFASSWNNGYPLPGLARSSNSVGAATITVMPYRDQYTVVQAISSTATVTRQIAGYDKATTFDVDADGKYFVIVYVDGTSPFYTYIAIGETLRDTFTIYPSMILYSVANNQNLYLEFDPLHKKRFTLTRDLSTTSRVVDTFELVSTSQVTLISSTALTISNGTKGFLAYNPGVEGQGMIVQDVTQIAPTRMSYNASNLDSTKLIGILTESGVTNDTKKVQLLGGIYEGYSGLTPGLNYYVAGDGTVTTGSTGNVFLGRAISSTTIKLKAPQ